LPTSIRLAHAVYEGLWRIAAPFLRRHRRLREGLPQRLGRTLPRGPFDLWIQAASAGEAYLACLLIDRLGSDKTYRILVTTNTRQGKDIVETAIDERFAPAAPRRPVAAYFPFDRPSLMQRALAVVQPRLVVLLETEIWPGLLCALKAGGIPVLIVNGRLQAKSLRHYRLWPGFWRALAPERILAVSAEDAARYARLFGTRRVAVMPNMKFDRIRTDAEKDGPNPVADLVPHPSPLVVLGSVRREEEAAVALLLHHIRSDRRDLVIALFPRHMHRIAAWRRRLEAAGIPYRLRSRTTSTVDPGTVLLWDVFGELARAYAVAQAAFVGGSLAPLGGQNFLEPLTCGVVPTIGPSWETFRWVGKDLFRRELVRVARDGRQAADMLLATLAAAPSRETVQAGLADHVAARRGGTTAAVAVIERFLQDSRRGGVTAGENPAS
jgi:3-deoxy-D-manno-octulosonic-acid transferase